MFGTHFTRIVSNIIRFFSCERNSFNDLFCRFFRGIQLDNIIKQPDNEQFVGTVAAPDKLAETKLHFRDELAIDSGKKKQHDIPLPASHNIPYRFVFKLHFDTRYK